MYWKSIAIDIFCGTILPQIWAHWQGWTFFHFGGRQEPHESWGDCHVKFTLNKLEQHHVDMRQSMDSL